MDESFSSLTLPVFSFENITEFRKDVELWSMISTLPMDKQALALTYSLPQPVKVKVFNKFNDLDDLRSNRGLHSLLDFLEITFKDKGLYSQFRTFVSDAECDQGEESAEEYIARFEESVGRVQLLDKDLVLTFQLVRGCNLSIKDKEELFEELSKSMDGRGLFERTKDLLKKWHPRKKMRFSTLEDGEDRGNDNRGFLDLPNEILRKIFLLLETRDILSLGAVNKKLHTLMEEYSPWRLLAPSPTSFIYQDSLLNHVARCRNLVELRLPSRKGPTDFNSLYAQVAVCCRHLQSLTVTVFDRHDLEYLAFLFDSCTEITRLKLKSSELVLIDLRTLKMIGNRLPHLTHLEISDNFMDPAELTYISQKFRNLKHLVLQVYGNSDAESNEAIRLIGERCTCLEVLKLQGFYMNESSLKSIQENCSSLKIFLLSPDKDIQPEQMKEFGRKCHRLEELHLQIGDTENINISLGRGFSGLLESLPNLTSLYFYEDKRSLYPLPILEPLAEMCTRLKELSLYLYADENQVAASLRAYFQSPGSNCLEKFVLRYNMETIVKSLRDIGRCCPNLKILQLGKVSISELDFLYVLRGCTRLEELVMAEMNILSWVCDVGRFCQNLKRLSIDSMNEIYVMSFVKNCKKLQKLDITEPAVPLADIRDELTSLENLETLRVYTMGGDVCELATMFSACSRLKKIYLNHEREEIQQLRILVKRPVAIEGFREISIDEHENSWTSVYLLNFASTASQ